MVRGRDIRINKEEAHLYKIRDASEKLMMVVGTAQLLVIPQGSCIQYRARAIVTSSMTCLCGLLGFPDMVALGLISGNWVTKDHACKAKVADALSRLPMGPDGECDVG